MHHSCNIRAPAQNSHICHDSADDRATKPRTAQSDARKRAPLPRGTPKSLDFPVQKMLCFC
nr:MAG TPA: hypothetical protein [Caudoviricetes sp.]